MCYKSLTDRIKPELCPFILLMSLCGVVGSIGNFLLLIVFYRRRNASDKYNKFIKFLAIIDFIVSSIVIPYTIIYELHNVTNDVICRLFEVVRCFFVASSNFSLCAVALERFYAVCKPTKKMSTRTIHIALGMIVSGSIVTALPMPFIFVVQDIQTPLQDNKTANGSLTATKRYCTFTDSILGTEVTLIYFLYLMLLFVLGAICICFLYGKIYRKLSAMVDFETGQERRRQMLEVYSSSQFDTRERVQSEQLTRIPHSSAQIMPVSQVIPQRLPSCSFNTAEPDTLKYMSTKSLPTGMTLSSPIPTDSITDTKKSQLLEHESIPSLQSTSDINIDSELMNKVSQSENVDKKLAKPRRKLVSSLKERLIKLALTRLGNTGIMLFVCSLIYLITWIPFWIEFFQLSDNLILRHTFMIGHVSNPIVYGVMNKRLRTEMIELFKVCQQ